MLEIERRHEYMQKELAVNKDDNFFDNLQICFSKVNFAHLPGIQDISTQVPQGTLVLVTGPKGTGKTTLLNLLTDKVTPDQGELVYPPHLRVLNVSKVPVLLAYMNLYENLTFGSPTAD